MPHAELMPGVSVFVGHGGHGSAMTALAHDVPVVVLPLDPRSRPPDWSAAAWSAPGPGGSWSGPDAVAGAVRRCSPRDRTAQRRPGWARRAVVPAGARGGADALEAALPAPLGPTQPG